MIITILLILGLITGSFISALSSRLEKPKTMIADRSRCTKCKHQLGFWDLFPIFSYLFLQGKCRYCKKPISPRYPLLEIFTTLVFILPAILTPDIELYQLILYLLISIILISIFIIDFETMYIPDYLAYTGIFVALAWAVLQYTVEGQNYLYLLLGPLIGGGIFLILVLASREKWMGGGDIWIGVILGLLLAYPLIIVNLFLSFIIGGIIGLVLLLLKKAKRKTEIPMGPFLILGFYIAYFWGQQILDWYLSYTFLNI
ncbi:prepilin peptidase [Patescibacteria group bacterium]